MKSKLFFLSLIIVFGFFSIWGCSGGGDDDDAGGSADDDDSPPVEDDDDNNDDDTSPDDDDDNDNDDDDNDDTTPDDDDDDDDNDNDDTITTAPGAPDELRAVAAGPDIVHLSWTDNADVETGFKIYRQDEARTFVLIATTGANVPIYLDNSVECESPYDYYVTAYNAVGESDHSNTAVAVTDYCDVAPPSDLSTVAINETRVDLFWLDNSFNEDNFQVQRRGQGEDAWFNLGDVEANVTTFSDVDAECGSDYDYRIRAYNRFTASPWSNVSQSTTNVCPPVRPRPGLSGSSPNSYVALSKEFDFCPGAEDLADYCKNNDPAGLSGDSHCDCEGKCYWDNYDCGAQVDPVYPLTLTGAGISADSMVEVGDFMLPCDTAGEGSDCRADDEGIPVQGTCATSCRVALPDEIMRHTGEYVVRLNTPDPVYEGQNTSNSTRFFLVVSPLPEIERIWPRGILQSLDDNGFPIGKNINIKVWAKNLLDNFQVRLGPNYGELIDITEDSYTGTQVARVMVSTHSIFPRDDPYEFAIENPSPGGGAKTQLFGVNPENRNWHSPRNHLIPQSAVSGNFPVHYDRFDVRPKGRNLIGMMGLAGKNNIVSTRDENGNLLSRVNLQNGQQYFPLPFDSYYFDVGNAGTRNDASFSLVDEQNFGKGGLGLFDSDIQLTTSAYLQYAKCADINGDGNIDIVFRNQNDGIQIHYNDGSGAFPTHEDINFVFEDSITVSALSLVDVNADGLIDIMCYCGNSFTGDCFIMLVLNQAEDGFSQEMIDLANPFNGFNTGDFNNDGFPDYLLMNWAEKRLNLYRNNGQGAFYLSAIYELPSPCYLSRIQDVDGDDLADIACLDNPGHGVFFLLNNPNGMYTITQTIDVIDDPRDMEFADINNDGAVDMVISTYGSTDQTAVYFGKGNGVFDYQGRQSVGSSNFRLLDYDGDNLVDIITLGRICYGNGDGTFENGFFPISWTKANTLTEVADLNSDGAYDLIAGTGGSPGQGAYYKLSSEYQQHHQRVDLTVGTGWCWTDPIVKDMDNDGKMDVLVGHDYTTEHVGIFYGYGNGAFQDKYLLDFTTKYDLTAVDINGDDYLDIFVRGVKFKLNNQDGTFGATQTVAMAGSSLQVVDLDLDDKYDLITYDSSIHSMLIKKGNGDGTFTGDWTQFLGDNSQYKILFDLDGDNYLDILALDLATDELVILYGEGAMAFSEPVRYTVQEDPDQIYIEDVNDDDAPDILVSGDFTTTSDLIVLLADGSGGFGAPSIIGEIPRYSFSVTFGDFDHDGNKDLVNGSFYDNLNLWFGNGDGSFRDERKINVGSLVTDMLTTDINGDGNDDIVVAEGFSSSIVFLLGKGDGTFKKNISINTGDRPDNLVLADMDRDGVSDLIFGHLYDAFATVFLMRDHTVWHQELADSFSDDPDQPWLQRFLPVGLSELMVHQYRQEIETVGVRVVLEWAQQPSGSVTLTLVAPDDQTVALGTFSAFEPWPCQLTQGDCTPQGWRLNKTFREQDLLGETGIEDLADLYGEQPTGNWRLQVQNSAGSAAEVKNFTVITDGVFY